MKQIENYLSRINQNGVRNIVLLTRTKEILKFLPLLLESIRPEKIYCVLPEECINIEPSQDNDQLIYCDLSEIARIEQPIDMMLFDLDCSCELEQLPRLPKKYLIGCMNAEEDYFSLWEANRDSTEHIYIEQMKTNTAGSEILEWDQADSDIELSVILPVYNVSKYLPQCIESLTRWKAAYVEYLFVDDGSTDESAAVIQNYAAKDSRIRLIQKKNGGCASARNKGIECAKGRYIGFVDSDDFVDETMFRKLLKRAMLGNYDLTYCGYCAYYEETGASEPVLNDCLTGTCLTGEYNTDMIRLLAVNTRVAIWRCLYKKSVLDEHQIRFHEDLKRFDDLPFRVEYTFASKSAVCISEYLYYYRLGRKGQDTACTDERLYVHFDIFRYLDRYVQPSKDRLLLDLLQAVKIQTHGFGLSVIQKQYRKNYARQAKIQLKAHAGYVRNIIICLLYAGRGNIGWITRLWFGLY